MRIDFSSILAGLGIALMLGCPEAFAHAQLQSAVPAVGGTITTSPAEITLDFNEGVEPRLSTITLATAAGAPIALGKPATAAQDAKILIAKLPKALPPGLYQVTWHAVSVDTHRTQGSFQFTIAP